MGYFQIILTPFPESWTSLDLAPHGRNIMVICI
jgi:hypothetical protein